MKTKQLILCSLFLGFAIIFSGCSEKAQATQEALLEQKNQSQIQTFALDTIIDLKASGENAKDALQEAQKEIYRLENLLSVTKEKSEITALNKNAGIAPVSISEDTLFLLETAKKINIMTNNSFNIAISPVVELWGFRGIAYHVPTSEEITDKLALTKESDFVINPQEKTAFLNHPGMGVDLGGIAKGYISDKITELMKEKGISSAIISLGGNISAIGYRSNGEKWRVAVQDPLNQESFVGKLSISDVSVITSGGYQRYFEEDGKTYHHIIDPKTGYPADSGLLSVTIISENGTKADGLSTALFVLGLEDAVALWKESDDFEVIFVTDKKEVLATEGIAEDFIFQGEEEGYQYSIISK